jgi:leucyl aminopeptidase (aminopeptidase T)
MNSCNQKHSLSILPPINDIYRINLKVKKDENILVFTDNVKAKLRKIAKLTAGEGQKFTKKICYLEYKATKSHGAEPPKTVWIVAFGKNTVKALQKEKLLFKLLNKKANKQELKKADAIVRRFKKEAVNAVIALSYYSTSHTKFRNLLTKICGTRYASMPLFDRAMLKGAMRVNWQKMAERTKKIAQRVNRSEKIEIKTPNGTYINLSKKGRTARADTGDISKKGAFSNLPAGEVFLAPLEGTSNGRLVLEWAPTHKLKSPVILTVKNGAVIQVSGNEEYTNLLRKKLAERAENTNIAELGIGTNDKASRPDNILESEKILGTIHIALGDNSSFGGKVITPFHQDFVFFKPTVVLIDKTGKRKILLKNGRMLI